MNQPRIFSFLFLAGIMFCTNLVADTNILFNGANTGPAASLEIQDVYITGYYGTAPMETVAGSGLGYASSPGPFPSVSRGTASQGTPGIQLSVFGKIESVTILPFAMDQNGNPISLEFAASESIVYPGTPGFHSPEVSTYVLGSAGPGLFGRPVTFSGNDSHEVDLDLFDDWGGVSEGQYLKDHPNVTSLTWGYSILSADVIFDTTGVPDQSATWVLLVGSAGILFLANRFRRCA